MDRAEMDQITQGMSSKSDKIRALSDAGAGRSTIAEYLGIRYQFVRNVLVAPRPSNAGGGRKPPSRGSTLQPDSAPEAPLTIEAAKRGLAAHFSVPVEAIEITIRG